MIAGSVRRKLTLDAILECVDEYSIYRHYLGHDFKLGVPFSSPFHEDRAPSASIIRTGKGKLHFTDFGSKKFSGKVVDFVSQFYPGCNFDQLLKNIDRDLQLGFSTGTEKRICRRVCPEELTMHHQRPKLIQVISRPFTKMDMAFWGMYHLGLNELRAAPTIYAIERVYIDKELFALEENELAYGFYFGDGKWKIYRPFARQKRYKWRCNIDQKLLYGTATLNSSKGALQVKSVKDYKVASTHYDNCYGIQSENRNVIGEQDLNYLLSFPWILICNDPDPAGIAATEYYTQLNQKFKPFEIPASLVQLPHRKDLADMSRYYGPSTVEMIIRQNLKKYENLRYSQSCYGELCETR